MKSLLCLTVCALSLLVLASTAHSGGAEASGDFSFELGTATGQVSFTGVVKNDGTVNGSMSFTATMEVGNPAVETSTCTGEGETRQCTSEPDGDTIPTTVALGFQLDCMLVNGNRAAMSGTVSTPTDS